MRRTSKSAEENLSKPNRTTTRAMSKSKVKETRAMVYGEPEVCCGTTCDKDRMLVQHKLLGVEEFVRLYIKTVVLTDAQKHCLGVIASEYKMVLIPLV